jgi:hypothetical protein
MTRASEIWANAFYLMAFTTRLVGGNKIKYDPNKNGLAYSWPLATRVR